MKRHNQILTAVLVLQIVLVAVVFWPRVAASGGESSSLLGELETGNVVALTIEDENGNQITLREKGGGWVLPDADDYPSQETKITELLDKLVALSSERLVTRTAASHERLKVARGDFVRRVDLETDDGTSHTLLLGSSPSYGATHVRLQGQDETYLAGDLPTWEVNATASAWVDTAYLSVVQDSISTITLQNSNGEWTLEKGQDGEWTLVGLAGDEELDSNSVNTVVTRVSTVNLLEPLGKENDPAYELDEPVALVTLETADDTITLQVGAMSAEDNSYVVKSSGSPYYVSVSEYSVKDLVEKSHEGFIVLPPTPTPAAE